MATYVKTLKEGNNLIAPRTLASAVDCGDGNLESYLELFDLIIGLLDEVLIGYETDWANSLTITGQYFDANHITESGCSLVVDRYHGMAFLTLQSGNSSYENVYFDSETITLPPGVTFLPTQKYGGTTSGTAQTYFTAVFTNITGPIDVVVDLAAHSTSNDYVKPTITMTYV